MKPELNMKTIAVNLLLAFLLALSAGVGYSANAAPVSLESQKAEQQSRIDTRIKRLQDERACISAATTREALRSCRQQFKPMQKSGSVQ
jgi:hypothetical protein